MPKKKRRNLSTHELLKRLMPDGKIPLRVAQRIIMDCCYWYDHPCGHPVRAPNHHKNITAGFYGWQWTQGANTFAVGRAIEECVMLLKEYLAVPDSDRRVDSELFAGMEIRIRASVLNFEGTRYVFYETDNKHYMKFGSQAISIPDFINSILRYIRFATPLNPGPQQ